MYIERSNCLDWKVIGKEIDGGDDATISITATTNKLSLNDVIMFFQKGHDLTWDDFEKYKYIETGSGLYIRVYEINELFERWLQQSAWIDNNCAGCKGCGHLDYIYF